MNTKERAQWMSDNWALVAQGGVWEYYWSYSDGWQITVGGPGHGADLRKYRVVMPPVPKQIDLTPLIESGLDCEFWNDGQSAQPSIAPLRGPKQGFFEGNDGWQYEHCQPRMSPHVHYWGGKSSVCPVPDGFVIQIHWNGDDEFTGGEYRDYTRSRWYDITAFRVLRVADGYTLIGGGE